MFVDMVRMVIILLLFIIEVIVGGGVLECVTMKAVSNILSFMHANCVDKILGTGLNIKQSSPTPFQTTHVLNIFGSFNQN